MPSRQLSTSPPSTVVSDVYPPSPPPDQVHHHNHYKSHHLLPPILASSASACSLFLVVVLCCRRLTRKRTTPSSDSESKPPYRFSYSLLRRATSSFSTRLGHGGFGPVFSGTLPSTRQPIAVKLMDSTSLQGEREFHNELFFASRLRSQHLVSAIGFSSDSKRRRFLLVYELMQNGNLQDALLHRKCPELMEWKKRFAIIVDIAKGIQYLHSCDPPVIHGDIKPSNILLDRYFSAKIGDFGLARLKSESQYEIGILGVDGMGKKNGGLDMEDNKRKEELESNGVVGIDDCGSLVEETESVNTGFEEGSIGAEQSPDDFVRVSILETSPETIDSATALAAVTSPEGNLDKASIQNEKDIVGDAKKNDKGLKSRSVKEWWWKHDIEAAAAAAPVAENKKVKDYVMEWIGKEVNKERPKSDWVGASASSSRTTTGKPEKKKSKKRLEWWALMDVDGNAKNLKKEKRRPAREWWKEEYCEVLAKKKKKKKKQQQRKGVTSDDIDNGDNWWEKDDDLYTERKKTKKDSRGSRGNLDWWLDGLSGELWRARRNSYDSHSGEIPKSGGISSTPSMRGTVCYVAPEYGYGGDVSEKCDVYSFGVLLLVIISGRRPLQVTNSPLSEFQRANLLSWARICARNGKLLDLVDQSIQSLDKEQALLCITVALLCLLKSPARRPSIKEVVGMLSGELEPPQLPVEYSPSPPSRFPFKSRTKAR